MAENNLHLSPVQEYYKGKTIFITGGSGFMGKVLIEKLLYACPDIKEILILLRPKRGKIPESRIEDMFKLPMFQRIRDEKPEVMKKLVPVQGDVTFDTLGLSGDNLEKVLQNTAVVFHCAATLRLEAKLKDAIEMNTTGTKRVLDICKKMKRLEAFIHLSTAFCYCDHTVLKEKMYDCPHEPEDLMRCSEWMDVKTLEIITPNLLKPHPNTYTYSKRLAEVLVNKEYPNLPVAITRPSIVSPAFEEPLPGWVDSLNGPVGLMVGAGKGVIRSMLCNGEYRSEIIPVDIAINGLITIAYEVGSMKERPKSIPVYNLTCIDDKKLTWEEVLNMGKRLNEDYPFEAGVWYPGGNITTSKIKHTLNVIFLHWLPAYLIDFLLMCCGQKQIMKRIHNRVSDGLEVLQFFTMRQWEFKSDNFMAVYDRLTPTDKKLFDMDMHKIEENEYMKRSILGGRQFCMKEPLTTLPKARMQMKAMYVLDRVTKFLLLAVFIWYFLKVTGLDSLLMNTFGSTKVHIKPSKSF